MKQINKCRALLMAVLVMLATDCKSGAGDDIFELTTAVSYGTVYLGTSSNKIDVVHGVINNELKAIQFAKLNWSNLTADMAKGQGDYLSAITDLLSIQSTKKSAFYAMSKNKFSQLIPSSNTTAEQLVISLKAEAVKL